MSFKLRSVICALCLPFFSYAERHIELGVPYDSKEIEDFEEIEEYLFYRRKLFKDIAESLYMIKNTENTQRYFYFLGKSKAYEELLNLK